MKYAGDWDSYRSVAVKDFSDLFGQFKNLDGTAIILPYLEQNRQQGMAPIQTPQAAKNLNQFTRAVYFHKLSFPPKPSGPRMIYADVYLRLSKDPMLLLQRINHIIGPTKFSVVVPPLQVEAVREIGWFVRSHKDIDKEALEKAIWTMYHIRVELRLKTVNPHKDKKTPWTEADHKIKALHVFIADGDRYFQEKTEIEEAYRSTATEWPMGIKMRFLAIEPGTHLTAEEEKFYQQIRNKQSQFTNQLKTVDVTSIITTELDSPQAEWGGNSIRDLLMDMKLEDEDGTPTDKPLFHDVTREWTFLQEEQLKKPVMVCYNPYQEADVMNRLAMLLPRLKYDLVEEYGQEALQPLQGVFSQEALQRHQHDTWDPVTRTIDNRRFTEWETMADDDSWTGEQGEDDETVQVEGMSQVQQQTQLAPRDTFGNDTQTLGSLRQGQRSALEQSRVSFAEARGLQNIPGILRNGSGTQGSAAGAQ